VLWRDNAPIKPGNERLDSEWCAGTERAVEALVPVDGGQRQQIGGFHCVPIVEWVFHAQLFVFRCAETVEGQQIDFV